MAARDVPFEQAAVTPFPSRNVSWYGGIDLLYGYPMPNSCDFAIQFANGYILREPSHIPLTLAAVLIGLFGYKSIISSGLRNAQFYAYSFLMYAVMMSSALFTDSLIPYSDWITLSIVGWIDASFTVNIAIMFGFNGLADIGVIDESSPGTRRALLSCFGASFFAFAYCIYIENFIAGTIVYLVGVLAFCGAYVVCEVVRACRGQYQGFSYLLLAGTSGAVGVYALMNFPAWLCRIMPLFGNSPTWFLLSDVAMVCIYKYFMVNHAAEIVSSSNDNDASKAELKLKNLNA